jgi:hypothetical protein
MREVVLSNERIYLDQSFAFTVVVETVCHGLCDKEMLLSCTILCHESSESRAIPDPALRQRVKGAMSPIWSTDLSGQSSYFTLFINLELDL